MRRGTGKEVRDEGGVARGQDRAQDRDDEGPREGGRRAQFGGAARAPVAGPQLRGPHRGLRAHLHRAPRPAQRRRGGRHHLRGHPGKEFFIS